MCLFVSCFDGAKVRQIVAEGVRKRAKWGLIIETCQHSPPLVSVIKPHLAGTANDKRRNNHSVTTLIIRHMSDTMSISVPDGVCACP